MFVIEILLAYFSPSSPFLRPIARINVHTPTIYTSRRKGFLCQIIIIIIKHFCKEVAPEYRRVRV